MVVPDYLEEIRALASQFRQNERNLPLYFPNFETTPEPYSLNRVFGAPVGVTADNWPVYPRLGELLSHANLLDQWRPGDLRMEHVFTIDLRGLKLLGAPAEARAMQLFLSNASYNHADRNGNRDTAVVFLTQDDVDRGLCETPLPERSLSRWSRRFNLERIDVPGDVFDERDDDTEDILGRLYEAIWQAPARLGGCPIWIQTPADPWDFTPLPSPLRPPQPGLRGRTDFMMQFERRFADVNLGNHGVMYVSGAGAYYQSFEFQPDL